MSKKLLSIVTGAIVIFIILMISMFYKASEKPKMPVKIPTVSVMTVKNSDHQETLSALGHVESVEGIVIKATASGRVTKVGVKSGQSVKKGDILIEIDPESTIANLEDNAAQTKLDEQNLTRYQTLFKKDAISAGELDQAQATYEKDLAQKKVYLADLNDKIMRAPFDGTLGVVHPKIGAYINVGDDLFSLQNLKPIYVNFALPSKDQSQVKLNQVVNVSFDAYKNEIFSGKVTAIDNVIQKDSNSILVRAKLANDQEKLLPGDLVNVSLVIAEQANVVMIPSESIVYQGGKTYVFVVNNNKVSEVSVTLGSQVGEDNIIVTSGLKAGDVIVSAGGSKLSDGSEIRIAK